MRDSSTNDGASISCFVRNATFDVTACVSPHKIYTLADVYLLYMANVRTVESFEALPVPSTRLLSKLQWRPIPWPLVRVPCNRQNLFPFMTAAHDTAVVHSRTMLGMSDIGFPFPVPWRSLFPAPYLVMTTIASLYQNRERIGAKWFLIPVLVLSSPKTGTEDASEKIGGISIKRLLYKCSIGCGACIALVSHSGMFYSKPTHGVERRNKFCITSLYIFGV